MSQPELASGLARYRKAQKQWRCRAADPGPNYRTGCLGDIPPGAQYVEYLGEAPAYQSGYRYCLPCGIALWNAEVWR